MLLSFFHLSVDVPVCHQYQETTGYCVDSHSPGSHVWPLPTLLTSDDSSAAPIELHNASFRIDATGGGPLLRAAVDRYRNQVFAPVASSLRRPSGAPAVTLAVHVRDSESALPVTEQDESYELSLDESGGGTLRSNSTFGALRGLETFAQLVEYSTDGVVQLWELPITVRDAPRWKYRGLKVDTSRHFQPLPRLLNIIRGMESAKLNVLQWHVTDGPSFPIESKKFPALSAKGKFCAACVYTQDDVRLLVAFAREHGVRVIPELDIPGHSGFQFGMPEIVACPTYLASNGGARALDPTLDATYAFLTEWLSEQAEVFGDPLINVYGDEVRFECWNQSETVKSWMVEHSLRPSDFQVHSNASRTHSHRLACAPHPLGRR